ncbi:PLP-dependent aminotransferase family protein [Muricoccus aerilatus]|uniref:MocR-like pyridoxine biosynthesis transcription factor PdxR n=1 Tax=Muricoccus aerilatus TaxID=452982 RepID=UPI0005C1BEEB|nr:PLP-dependent aminotransferase family protein [Roseomonas aerilata]
MPRSSPPAQDRVTQRISEAIKGQIASGLLGPGAMLPSTRSLAVEWGVSRTTITLAYEQLIAEGYLEVRQGARARVAQGVGAPRSPTKRQASPTPPGHLSAFARRLEGFVAPSSPADRVPGVVDFRYGDLSVEDFPVLAWKKAIDSALLRRPARLRYGDPGGLPVLRDALQGYLWRARGLRCEPEQVIVVNGSQQGLDLCARLLLDPGDRAVMENPGYHLARQALGATGAEVLPVAVDDDGLRTADLPPARLAFVTPSHQFPLGGVLPAGRRRELLAWAQHHDAHVIEDDYDGEYRYDISPIPSLLSMDEAGRVIYLGTVSKTLSPTLRLGYLVVPPGLSHLFSRAKRLTDRHTPGLEQEALATLIASGAYERHVRRARRRNGERRAILLSALAATLGDTVTVIGAEAGLHVVVWLNGLARDQEGALIARARDAGLGIHPITPSYAPGPPMNRPEMAGLVMGYAGLDAPAIERGTRLLRDVLRDFVRG